MILKTLVQFEISKFTSTFYSGIVREGRVIFFIYSTFNKITSFPWKLNKFSYGVQFGINCTALNQSKLSTLVECTVKGVMVCFPFKIVHLTSKVFI